MRKKIDEDLLQRLTDLDRRFHIRVDRMRVPQALNALGVEVPTSFRAFYQDFEGPSRSSKSGFMLLDLCEQQVNIVSATEECRRVHGWPKKFVVLTELLGNAVLVLDAEKDRVFNVDFEGGDELLLSSKLEPQWQSFQEFLEYYFVSNAS